MDIDRKTPLPEIERLRKKLEKPPSKRTFARRRKATERLRAIHVSIAPDRVEDYVRALRGPLIDPDDMKPDA